MLVGSHADEVQAARRLTTAATSFGRTNPQLRLRANATPDRMTGGLGQCRPECRMSAPADQSSAMRANATVQLLDEGAAPSQPDTQRTTPRSRRARRDGLAEIPPAERAGPRADGPPAGQTEPDEDYAGRVMRGRVDRPAVRHTQQDERAGARPSEHGRPSETGCEQRKYSASRSERHRPGSTPGRQDASIRPRASHPLAQLLRQAARVTTERAEGEYPPTSGRDDPATGTDV